MARCKVVREGTLVLKLTVPSPLKPFHTFLLSLFFSSKTLINPSFQVSHSTTPSRIIPFLPFFLNFHKTTIIITIAITVFLSFISFLRSTRQLFGFDACRLGSRRVLIFRWRKILVKFVFLTKKERFSSLKLEGWV